MARVPQNGLLLGALLLALGCRGDPPPIRSEPLRDPGPGGTIRFRLVDPAESGLVFENRLDKPHVIPYLFNGAGLAVGDYDGDGRPDVYLVSQDGPNKLFRQTAPFRFADVTGSAGGLDGGEAWGTGASFVDIDGDGDLDLYVCNTEAPNLLYVNQGNGRFVEEAAEHGLAFVGASTMPAFADYDNDGDVDLYLTTNRVFGPTLMKELLADVKPPKDTRKSIAEMAPPQPRLEQDRNGKWIIPKGYEDHLIELVGRLFFGGQRDRLFQNDGRGRFTDVTDAAGIQDHGMGLAAVWWDMDDDGLLDLYVACDLESPDMLYRNRGDGTFENVTARSLPHLAYFGMGSDAADIDNDGRLDLIVADMASRQHYKSKMLMGDMGDRAVFLSAARPPQVMRNALFLNTGTERFMEIAYLAGVASTEWTWAIRFGDLDNDGFVDLFVTNGIPRFDNNPDVNPRFVSLWRQGRVQEALELARNIPAVPEKNMALRNDGRLHFDDVSAAWGLDLEGLSHGASFCDFDRDGDLDVILNNMNANASLYENVANDGQRIAVRLEGTRGNRFGLGARVDLATTSGRQTRLLTLSHGYLTADEPLLHFGLGQDTVVDELTVRWPSGAVQTFQALAAGRLYTITEPRSATTPAPHPAPAPATFAESAVKLGLEFAHVERPFDDFAAQPLVPHQHSQLGPGVAFGDADGDGQDDLWVGGARGQAGALFLAGDDGRYRRVDGPWRQDADCEDMGAVWFDADGDGDQDLVVTSGSVEVDPGDASLCDRLYLNDGRGAFAKAVDALPPLAESTGAVAAGDFDGDSDLDLFVGGRITAGRYPHAPPSRILRNDGGRFVDATAATAPALAQAGLVTAALWTDADGDGLVDLLLTAHWAPVRLFRNDGQGRLAERTAEAGLAAHSGLWNGIAGADLDGDGDLDYVVGNLGLNTKYKASAEHPARLYCADFDQNGVLDVIEAKYDGERIVPVRGRSCSSRAMPFLAEKFATYDAFARASLQEIYSLEALDESTDRAATTLSHAVLDNDGQGRFTVRPLPHLAQVAPAFGIVLCDFDGDGRCDVYLAQNFFTPEPETGRMDGSAGLLLRNDGGFAFAPLRPDVTGILVPEDAKGAALGDANDDGTPDLCVALNDGPLRLFARSTDPSRFVAVELRGRTPNPTAVGALVRWRGKDGRCQAAEVQAGSGYLSQSAARLWFGVGAGGELEVRWPDGTTTRHPVDAGGALVLRQP
jgi:hypothetical protein